MFVGVINEYDLIFFIVALGIRVIFRRIVSLSEEL